MKSLEAIAQFGRDHGTALAHALGFRRGKTPAKCCLSKLFRRLDVAALEAALGRWLLGRVERHGWDAIALDGKTAPRLRRRRGPRRPPAGRLRPRRRRRPRPDARSMPRPTSTRRPCNCWACCRWPGKVVTGDAMFTHRDLAQEVRDGGGDYLLIVKDNQPELKAQIQAALHGDADFSPLPA